MPYELIAIGCSWGGLQAVSRLLSGLPDPDELPVAVAVVQHRMSVDSELARLLGRHTRWPVAEAHDKDRIVAGRAFLAPAGYHLLVEPGRFALSTEAPVHHSRPSIDVLFESAADAYAERLIGVVLTGASIDGAEGLRHIFRRGGHAVVQDPGTAEQATMPAAAVATGVAHAILPLDGIAAHLVAVCEGDGAGVGQSRR